MAINPILTSKNIEEFNIDRYETLIHELSQINVNILDSELQTHTTFYAYYHGILVRAKRLLDNHIIALEALSSEFKNEKRKGGKVSVEALKDYANCDPQIRELQNEVAKYEEIYGLIKSVCQTLEHKKDMLVQLSANRRSETKLFA